MDSWRWIPGFEGSYQAHPSGRVRSVDRKITDKNGKRTRLIRGRVLKPQHNGNGFHFQVGLSRKIFYVHDLIALAFIGPKPPGQEARHRNCDGFDNRADNLLYGTKAENRQDSIEAGTIARGETHGQAKLTARQALEIMAAEGPNWRLAQRFGVTRRTVDRIKSGEGWKHLRFEGQPEMKGEA